MKKLHKVNDKLKGYSHVNKRAMEQYETFSKQKDDLIKRRKELEASGKSIDELVESLDQRKDEAIERTFKQVSIHFAEIFSRLVPAGRGKLRMQKSIDDVGCKSNLCMSQLTPIPRSPSKRIHSRNRIDKRPISKAIRASQ